MEGNRLYLPDHRRTVSRRSDFKQALAGKTGVSESIVSRGTGRPCLAVSVPILDGTEVIAVLRVIVDLEFFNRELLAPLPIGQSGRLLVMDPRLDLIRPKPGISNEPIAALPYVPPDIHIPQELLAKTSGIFRYRARDGLHMAAFRRLRRPAWVFVAEQPLREVLAPVSRFGHVALAMVAGLLLIVGAGIFMITRPSLLALNRCQQFAGDIRNGRLDNRLDVRRRDEIGLLGEALNQMAGELERRQRESEAAHQAREEMQETRRLLAEARWRALRYQLNPHFLFNVLNSVDALSSSAPERIPRLILNLAEYLRLTLDAPPGQLVPLRQELDAVQAYLAIEKVRYGTKLQVTVECDPDVQDQVVPDLVLQPLVENAVKFGMRTSPLPLRIHIAVSRIEDRLRIRVQNSGQWIDENSAYRDGPQLRLGMRNLRRRLQMIYGEAHRLTMHNHTGSVTVVLRLPMIDKDTTCTL